MKSKVEFSLSVERDQAGQGIRDVWRLLEFGVKKFLPRIRQGAEIPYRKAKTMKLLIEIRAAEGGADAKLLMREQFAIYVNAARLHRL